MVKGGYNARDIVLVDRPLVGEHRYVGGPCRAVNAVQHGKLH